MRGQPRMGSACAVGVRDRIGDQNVHHLRRVVPDLGDHPLADRLQPRRGPPGPGLGGGGVVHAEVGRGERAPVGGGALGAGGEGRRTERRRSGRGFIREVR